MLGWVGACKLNVKGSKDMFEHAQTYQHWCIILGGLAFQSSAKAIGRLSVSKFREGILSSTSLLRHLGGRVYRLARVRHAILLSFLVTHAHVSILLIKLFPLQSFVRDINNKEQTFQKV